MTREEAIKMLKSKLDGTVDTSYEWCECVIMAIKALEQEPKTDDDISECEHDHEIVKAYNDGQAYILDKIKAEILDTLYVDSLIFGELIDFKNGKINADDVIEEFNRVTRMEVLRIIDKYKAGEDT